MPQVRGVVLTGRDRVLVSYLGIARYASAEQIHRLIIESPNRKLVYRRLRKLCGPGRKPGEGAYLQRLEYRRPEGTAVPVWTLTSFGRAVADQCVPYLHPPAQHDIGHRFLEHTLRLNDVLLGLVVALRSSVTAPPLAQLPFQWLSEDDGVLEFEMFHRSTGTTRAVLKPDAILEVPGQRRRLFLEAETGTQSIATANPAHHGAVLQKLQRYSHFFTALAGDGPATYYAKAFPDGLFPVLVFLVHSDERRRRVEQAVKERLGAQPSSRFRARILTFADAAPALARFIKDGRAAEPAAHAPPSGTAIDELRLRQLRESCSALAEALNAMRRLIAEHNTRGSCRLPLPRVPGGDLRALGDLIGHDLLGEPRPSSGDGEAAAH